ncbi:MAG TPA: proprotein convertase P-domain-containing protein [Thermoanaerobaculia bacterium]|nr:proprotein convertase P-domain-containing protein [Thermoanaerobaculia bacterium]
MLLVTAALVLRLELVRHSLAGTHYRYGQYAGEQRIVGAEVDRTVRPDGTIEESSDVVSSSPGLRPPSSRDAGRGQGEGFLVNIHGTARRATRVIENRIVRYVDAETGAVLRVEPRFARAKPARVFDANPVKTLNDPSLQDQNNSAAAVPDAAYTTVDLDDVNPSGPLGGPYVQITDFELPAIAPADAAQSLMFDRSQTGFEDVNAYFHIDRSQHYLQSLGYNGGRTIAPYPVPVDTHALNGEDNSLFIPAPETGHAALVFGDGGTDDAEDPDLVVHEYAHVVHEWIAPGTFLGPFGSEARAISEGFADYWGFSASYEQSIRSGRDPFCFADWDARCWQDATSEHCGYPTGADCLRRLDSPKTIADFNSSDSPGTEYLNAPIWSSALREVFVALTQRYGIEAGRRISDTIVVESLFGAPPNPGFAAIARRMIAADRYLNAGANADVICAALTRRGILTDCVVAPRGELTLFQSVERGVAIPDNDPTGVVLHTSVSDPRVIERIFVRVDIDHAFRGDLRIVLIAPDGSQFVLQNPSPDRTSNIRATFGRDAVPVDSLDPLRGRSATGEWRLVVTDLRPRDAGTVLSWGLVIQFAGDEPAFLRPTAGSRQTIPVAGRIPGANGTFFTTDVRLLNRGTRDTTVTLIFTPSGADGRSDFAAVNVAVVAGQVVALNDVIGTWFGATGIGQLEIDGDVVVTSRTYTRGANGGTYGEAIPPARDRTRRNAAPLNVMRIRNNADFRTNIGFAETGGSRGTIEVNFLRGRGDIAGTSSYAIAAFSHLQLAVPFDAVLATIRVTEGDAEIVAYASVVDNHSGDATYVAGETAERERTVLAPAINGPGALGTFWSTDVYLTSGLNTTVVLSYQNATFASAVFSNALTYWPDIIRSQFGLPNTAGVMRTTLGPGAVASVVIVNSGTVPFAQSVSLLEPAIATSLDIPHVERSTVFRTNVGLMSDAGATVNVSLLDASGKTVETSLHTLAANQLDQFAVRTPVADGRIHIDVLSGKVAAYASIVDNVTGDAAFVPAQ